MLAPFIAAHSKARQTFRRVLSDDVPTPPPPTTVSVSPVTFTTQVGGTRQLFAAVENGVGQTTWESSDESVATVDSSGLVTATATGAVTITATNNGVSDSASGTVTAQEPAEEGDPITLLHGVMGVPSSDSVTIKFKSATNATGVRLAYSTDPAMEEGVQYTESQDLDDDNYCTFTATLTGLQADTEYYWAPFAAGELVQRNGVYGRFRTAPVGPASFKLAFGNCNQYSSGTPRDLTVWDHIREQEPAFLVHLDDFHYGDLTTTDVAPRVEADEEQMAMPRQGACYWRVPLVRGMGDHDFCGNDSYGGRGDNPAAGRFAAAEAYRITMPTPTLPHEEGMYYAFTWGRVRFIKLDGRYFRDSRWFTGSDKSMLGTTQKAWFKAEIDAAKAALGSGELALVVVLGDVPFTGATNSSADHWSGYNTERVEIANYIESAGLTGNLYWLVGDMHRQGYDDGTNTRFSTANSTDPAFPSACGGSFGNAQGEVKGSWSSVEDSNGQNRVGFLTITDDGGGEITVETSLRVVSSSDGSDYTENLSGPFMDTFSCTAAVTPFFSDSFESGDLSHTENGFEWTAEHANVFVSTANSRTGSYSLEFAHNTSGNPELRFSLGRKCTEIWVERWIWIPANYSHPTASPSNNKLFALWGDTYESGPSIDAGHRAKIVLELWSAIAANPGTAGDADLRVLYNENGGHPSQTAVWKDSALTDEGPLFRGQWNRLRVYANVGTGPLSGDGIVRVWIGDDSEPYAEVTDLNLYPTDDSVYGPLAPYFDHGYLWGYPNQRIPNISLFDDDIKFYDEDPGW